MVFDLRTSVEVFFIYEFYLQMFICSEKRCLIVPHTHTRCWSWLRLDITLSADSSIVVSSRSISVALDTLVLVQLETIAVMRNVQNARCGR